MLLWCVVGAAIRASGVKQQVTTAKRDEGVERVREDSVVTTITKKKGLDSVLV